ncbi:hypothetical protein BDZ89DRAFT_1138692 [Hymenopellis radicata]|nr:hypothetical protein BDZ89DRAFT_1138692 [Hymenopellis radicata]
MVKARKGGRPRKYLSDEERRAAHRLSNRQSWERHASEQNTVRRNKYRQQHPTIEQVIFKDAPGVYNLLAAIETIKVTGHAMPHNNILDEAGRRNLARVSVVQARQYNRQFVTYVGSDSKLFVEGRLADYLQEVSEDVDTSQLHIIDTTTDFITDLRQKCYNIRNDLWQRVGSGREYDIITEIMEGMRRVEDWLQDISCEALVSNDTLRRMHKCHQLQYQK